MSKKMIMLLVGLVAVIAVYSFYTKEVPQAENKVVDNVTSDSADQAMKTQEVLIEVIEEKMPDVDVTPKDVMPSDVPAKEITPGEAPMPPKEVTPDNMSK